MLNNFLSDLFGTRRNPLKTDDPEMAVRRVHDLFLYAAQRTRAVYTVSDAILSEEFDRQLQQVAGYSFPEMMERLLAGRSIAYFLTWGDAKNPAVISPAFHTFMKERRQQDEHGEQSGKLNVKIRSAESVMDDISFLEQFSTHIIMHNGAHQRWMVHSERSLPLGKKYVETYEEDVGFESQAEKRGRSLDGKFFALYNK